MNKGLIISLIVAASLILIGSIIFCIVMATLNWDFSGLSTSKLVDNEHVITEEYHGISIESNTANILFVPSDSEKTTVVCHEYQKEIHSVTVKDKVLTIELSDTRKWFEHIGINFSLSSPKITVYMPKKDYGTLNVSSSTGNLGIPNDFSFESIYVSQTTGSVKCSSSASETIRIKTSTGDININGNSAKNIELSVSTGDISVANVKCEDRFKFNVSTGKAKLSGVSCKSLVSDGNTGDVTLSNVIVDGRLEIERSTGKVKLEECDAAELFIETDTGDVVGTLLSDKVFITSTDTGKIDVPKTIEGGRCEITTDTGDIKISIVNN